LPFHFGVQYGIIASSEVPNMSQYVNIEGLRRVVVIVFVAIPLAAFLISATPAAAAATCESLASLKLPDTTITLAEPVAAGAFGQGAGGGRGGRGGGGGFSDLPAFCRIAATLKPSNDSDIKIEVW